MCHGAERPSAPVVSALVRARLGSAMLVSAFDRPTRRNEMFARPPTCSWRPSGMRTILHAKRRHDARVRVYTHYEQFT